MAINLANNNSLANITALPSSISGGGMTLISEQTASGSATIDFTSGIDDTYDSYVFKFYDIHPSGSNQIFSFQADTGTNTSYNQTITSTVFRAYHDEADSSTALNYDTASDQAQGTAFQRIMKITNDNDNNGAGTLKIFSPSSSIFVKHFIAQTNETNSNTYSLNQYTAGYINTTTPLTRFQFKFDSGNIDSGVIKLYGIS